jgi:hypothetical protein
LAFGGLDTEKLLGNAEMILWKILENPHIFIIPKGAGLLEVLFLVKKKENGREPATVGVVITLPTS